MTDDRSDLERLRDELRLTCIYPTPPQAGHHLSRHTAHIAAIRERLADVEPDDSRAVYAAYLAETIGVDLDELTDDERRSVEWLAERDANTIATVACLLDTAAHIAAGIPRDG